MLFGIDCSEFQGQINWDALNAVTNFVMIRASFGTARKDYQFDRNQAEARRVRANAGPLGIGYYYYAYARLLDPITSADYFVDNLGPLQVGEVLALDWEEPYSGDHVAWCLGFLSHVEARTGVKPLLYLNQSLMNSHDWKPVIDNDYGLWLAQYDGIKDGPAVASPWPVVAMRQWTDADIIAGVAGPVDGDVFYGDFDAFAAYGYKTAVPAPVPGPAVVVPDMTVSLPPTVSTLPPQSPVTHTELPTSPEAVAPSHTVAAPSQPLPQTEPNDPLSTPIKVPIVMQPGFETTLLHDSTIIISWFGTTYGKMVLQIAGAIAGWLLSHTGIVPLPDWITSLLGVVAGNTVSNAKNPYSSNSRTIPTE